MRRLNVKDILKQFYLRTSITGMGAQHLRSLFHAELNADAYRRR
jgi:hypothetical protein